MLIHRQNIEVNKREIKNVRSNGPRSLLVTVTRLNPSWNAIEHWIQDNGGWRTSEDWSTFQTVWRLPNLKTKTMLLLRWGNE